MTAIYLRPSATDAAGGWTTNSAGTDLHTAIDEVTQNDADFIRSGDDPSADVCRVRLAIDGAGEIAPQTGGVFTIYADANDRYADSGDNTGGSAGWEKAIAGTGSDTPTDYGAADVVLNVMDYDDNALAFVIQPLMQFDLSALSAGTYPQQLTVNQVTYTDSGSAFDLELRAYDWNPAASSNFVTDSSLAALTLLDTKTATSALIIKDLFSYTAAITATSTYRVIVSSKEMRLGTRPNIERLVGFSSADASGTTNDPRLVIDASANPVIIRYTTGKDGTAQINITVRLKQNTTTIATWTHTNVATGPTLHEQDLTEAQADEINWSGLNADTAPLFLEFEATKP